MTESKNHLHNQLSPYLQQHAENPVHWYPWGPEALERAQKEDKPIFLSIGYSTCHWCHVMAGEVFMDAQAANKLNTCFVSVKVDREERPDIDALYMAATVAMTGSGGWPLSLFLFPDGRPFFCATYIPLVSGLNRTGFLEVLDAIQNSWSRNRDQLHDTAEKVVRIIRRVRQLPASASYGKLARKCFAVLKAAYDPEHGGFGQAPKFPRPVVFDFLLHYTDFYGVKEAQNMAIASLSSMAHGGIYDQLGGGFHRYSVDASWRTPHFEKMLYDQAQLIEIYADAYQRTGKPLFSRVVHQTIGYLVSHLSSATPLFYSAEDADSADPYRPGKHGEGLYYLWSEEEIVRILGRQTASIFVYRYGVTFEGNLTVDPHNELKNRNILFVQHTLAEVADQYRISEQEAAQELARAEERLLSVRARRSRPHCDRKIITSWNSMLIRALVKAGVVFGEKQQYVDQAIRMADFLWQAVRNPESGYLYRLYDARTGQEKGYGQGQLADYAQLTAAYIALYQAVGEPRFLERAVQLTETQLALFWDNGQGCLYDSAPDATLLIRTYAEQDTAEPAANSVCAQTLLTMGDLTGEQKYTEKAQKILRAFGGKMESYPGALPLMVRVALGA